MSCIEESLDVRDTTSTLARFVYAQRLDDRIRALCAKAVKSQGPTELHNIFSELRAAMKEHIKRLRRLAIDFPESQRRAV